MKREQVRGNVLSDVTDQLDYIRLSDPRMFTALCEALDAAEFCIQTLCEADHYTRLSGLGKSFEGKEPGSHEYGTYRTRIIERLNGSTQDFRAKSVRVVGMELASRLDRRRDAFDGKSPLPSRPADVPGRPLSLTSAELRSLVALCEQGLSVHQVATAGVVPESSFYRYLKAGAAAHVGPERELFLAVETVRRGRLA